MHRYVSRAFTAPPSVLALGVVFFACTHAALGAAQSTRAAAAPDPVQIRVLLDAPATQAFGVEVRFPPAPVAKKRAQLETTTVHLPTWRPGRYAEVFPAATLTGMRAFAEDGSALEIHKTAGSSWRVQHAAGEGFSVTYRIYANSLGNRTRHVDATHAFLSGSTVFVYGDTHRAAPHRIELQAPDNWRVACGLDALPGDPRTLLAASYDELVDAPIEIGLHDRLDFTANGLPHELVIWPPGARFDEELVVADLTRLIEEQSKLFDAAPYARYVFLLHAGAGAGGGTEHRNSTIMQVSLEALESSMEVYAKSSGELVRPKDYRRFLGLASHEFFHTWNVKEIRPADIVPYEYQAADLSTLFWVAEGSTSYYDDLTLLRAGLLTEKQYLEALSDSIEGFRNRPGAAVQSLSEASFDSWIHGYGSEPNSANRSVSFYRKGSLATLLLDSAIREQTNGRRSFDDVFRLLGRRHGLATGGYTRGQLEGLVVEVVLAGQAEGDASSATSGASGSSTQEASRNADRVHTTVAGWFAEWIDGTAPLPLEEAFERVGLELVQVREGRGTSSDKETDGDEAESDEETAAAAPPATAPEESVTAPIRADLGLDLTDRGGKTLVTTARSGGPAEAAGVQSGDELVAFAGRKLSSSDVERRLRLYTPGEVVPLHLLRGDRLIEVEVQLGERVDGNWKLRKVSKDRVSAEQQLRWGEWTGTDW